MQYQVFITLLTIIITSVGWPGNFGQTAIENVKNTSTQPILKTTISNLSAQKSNGVKFICRKGHDLQTNKPQYTTYAWTPEGKRAVIRWVKKWHNSTVWTPQSRCQTVSQRFQEAYDNGSLKYIANGWKNNQAVVCTARERGADCATILMTLRPEDDPIAITKDVVNLLNGRATGVIRHSSNSNLKLQQYYAIDFDKFLEIAPIE
ncbi:MAG TPA: hypothetical protein DCF68_22535 [Cyanothece sp. UBA12306]|nr:hypothetical protein [Cyanothece sp. UBA12306]